MKRVDINAIATRAALKVVCFILDHAWLSSKHNHRKCNRCGEGQYKGPATGYEWKKIVCIVKEFKPVD